MLSFKKITGLAAAVVLASGIAAQAAPWQITGGVNQILTADPVGGFGAGGSISSSVVRGGQLNLTSGAPGLKYTYLGKEAGALNVAFDFNGAPLFDNNAAVPTSAIVGPVSAQSPLVFSFTTNFFGVPVTVTNPTALNAASQIAFYLPFANSSIVYALFDDGGGAVNCASGDCDFNDMIVAIQVVPLPAAAWLILAGIGGLGLVSRRRKAAA